MKIEKKMKIEKLKIVNWKSLKKISWVLPKIEVRFLRLSQFFLQTKQEEEDEWKDRKKKKEMNESINIKFSAVSHKKQEKDVKTCLRVVEVLVFKTLANEICIKIFRLSLKHVKSQKKREGKVIDECWAKKALRHSM